MIAFGNVGFMLPQKTPVKAMRLHGFFICICFQLVLYSLYTQ